MQRAHVSQALQSKLCRGRGHASAIKDLIVSEMFIWRTLQNASVEPHDAVVKVFLSPGVLQGPRLGAIEKPAHDQAHKNGFLGSGAEVVVVENELPVFRECLMCLGESGA